MKNRSTAVVINCLTSAAISLTALYPELVTASADDTLLCQTQGNRNAWLIKIGTNRGDRGSAFQYDIKTEKKRNPISCHRGVQWIQCHGPDQILNLQLPTMTWAYAVIVSEGGIFDGLQLYTGNCAKVPEYN